ncbi:hypothetical protein F511_31411 [Dorcoceras hygrometricum]|uniref:Uncharacterized protein n=1 Tax=Dorcoceras hygrometricum TaxID=472368 RepID=A0A2Z7DFN9_9LAMI|nr:hypothetical protein F511_31411 [Dorcoceras hygrometricum]
MTSSQSADEERSSGARRSAGELSYDDISSDITISRKLQQQYIQTCSRTRGIAPPVLSSSAQNLLTLEKARLLIFLILFFGTYLIGDRDYDEAMVMGMNRMFICWIGPAPGQMGRFKPITPILIHGLGLYCEEHYTTQNPSLQAPPTPLLQASLGRRAAAACRNRTCSYHLVVEIPFVSNSSALLVQTDEGVLFPVVDWIRRSTAAYRGSGFSVNLVGARRLDASKVLRGWNGDDGNTEIWGREMFCLAISNDRYGAWRRPVWPYQLGVYWASDKYESAFTFDRTGLQISIGVSFQPDDAETEAVEQDIWAVQLAHTQRPCVFH